MSYSLPKYYFQDIPEYVMDEIINGMIEGKTEPTPEEMEEWLTSDWNAKPKRFSHRLVSAPESGTKSRSLSFCSANRHPQATWHQAQTVRQECMQARRLSQFVVLFLSGLPLLANAQQRSADGDKVIALEKKWTEAYKQRNVGILSSLLAEEFVITVEDGSTYGKLGYISHSADSSVRVEVAELSDLRVRVHGNVAVVTGAYRETGTSKGKPYEYRDRLTDVWVKSPAGWQVIASHYSVPLTP